MIHENQEHTYPVNDILSVLAGILIGALAGAVTMLLLAPQSGKDTRMHIQKKAIELRDRTTETVEDTMAQVRTHVNKISMGVKDYGRELADEQLDHVPAVVEAGKTAVKRS